MSARAMSGRVVLRVALLGGALVLAPYTLSARQGLAVNAACAETGTCCPESRSICNAGGTEHMDYYYKSEGCCGPFCLEQ